MATASLSHDFIQNVRLLYKNALGQLVSRQGIRQGVNCHTIHAAPALVSSVAAVEAFLNEFALSSIARVVFPKSPLWTLEKNWLQQLDVRMKLVIVPFLLFSKTFDRDTQPYQDFSLLVKARNEVVHYKMDDKIPNYLKNLQDRRIALTSHEGYPQLIWIHALCCSEVIRWANNTAALVTHALVEFMPEEAKPLMSSGLADNFVEIPDTVPIKRLTDAGVDPNSNDHEIEPGTGIQLP